MKSSKTVVTFRMRQVVSAKCKERAVIKYYRQLLKTGFGSSGSFENASIFRDSVGEKVIICGSTGDYMQLYVNVVKDRIDDIKYLCVCDPTANVAVEILCILTKCTTLDEVNVITEQAFCQFLGSNERRTAKKS